MKMKKKEWHASVKIYGDCKYIACDECPFSLERGSQVCVNASDFSDSITAICKHIMAKLDKKWAKKAEKLKELGGGI